MDEIVAKANLGLDTQMETSYVISQKVSITFMVIIYNVVFFLDNGVYSF